MTRILNTEGIVLEPAGALSMAALEVHGPGKPEGQESVVAVVSGGNFDFERLPDVKERAMRYAGTKKYFILRLAQRPGALKDFLELLGPKDDIARFEYLKKSARNFGSILIGIETSSPENFLRLTAAFEERRPELSGHHRQRDHRQPDHLSGILRNPEIRSFGCPACRRGSRSVVPGDRASPAMT
jgi:threonine dehydratase